MISILGWDESQARSIHPDLLISKSNGNSPMLNEICADGRDKSLLVLLYADMCISESNEHPSGLNEICALGWDKS